MPLEIKQPRLQGTRIFLSYAREDTRKVRAIYDKLTNLGLKPWFDITDLEPGQDWQQVIGNAIKNARFVLLFLSRTSVEKQGYFQREITEALRVAETVPDGQRYIIPVRLEECRVPDKLSNWHWADTFRPHGLRKLVGTLQQSLGQPPPIRRRHYQSAPKGPSKEQLHDLFLAARIRERGELLLCTLPDGKVAVSDGAMLEIVSRVPRAIRDLKRELHVRRFALDVLQRMIPSASIYQKDQNVVKNIRIAGRYYFVLESKAGSRRAVDPDYLVYVLRKHPRTTLYLTDEGRPIIAADGAVVRCLIMPMNVSEEELQSE